MEHNVKSLQKIYNRLVKDRVNNILDELNYNERIEEIEVSYVGVGHGYNSEDFKKKYSVYDINIHLTNDFNYIFYIGISFLLLNASDYVITDDYVITVTFFNSERVMDELTYLNNGTRYNDSMVIKTIKEEVKKLKKSGGRVWVSTTEEK